MISFKNFLYDHPEIYDLAFPDKTSSQYCLGAIERHSAKKPQSILDLGCGTGSTLEILAQQMPDCIGVDLLASMIEYGRMARPSLDLRVGDMATLDLGRTFDVICCFGWAFSYLLTDQQLEQGIATFSRHAHAGTLVTFDCGQADFYLSAKELPSPATEISTPAFKASARASLTLDREKLLLTRNRIWDLPKGEQAKDHCRYRLHRAIELKARLEKAGFEVREMAGDPTGKAQAPGERTLYVAASKGRT